ESASRRKIEVTAGAPVSSRQLATGDQHCAVGEAHSGRELMGRDREPDKGESAGGGAVDFCVRSESIILTVPNKQNCAVTKQGCGVHVLPPPHRTGAAKRVALRVIEFGRSSGTLRSTPGD